MSESGNFSEGAATQGSAAGNHGGKSDSLARRFEAHFGGMEGVQVLEHVVSASQMRNFHLVLPQFIRERLPGAVVTGIEKRNEKSDAEGVVHYLQIRDIRETLPLWVSMWVSETDRMTGLTNVAVFFSYHGQAAALTAWQSGAFSLVNLVIYSRDAALSQRLLDELLEFERERHVLRGRLVEAWNKPPGPDIRSFGHHRILPRSGAGWEDLILEPETRRRIEDEVIEHIRHAPALRRNGFETQRNVIFHGPAGTGKSLACRAVASALPGVTTVVNPGHLLWRLGESFTLARELKPAVVVIEDLDLFAVSRDENGFRLELGELLNELDGIGRREDVFVLFTARTVAHLEEALVRRAGRVDCVIEFPLPGEETRARLIRHFAGKALLEEADVPAMARATAGASPARIKEVMRRTLICALRAGSVTPEGFGVLRREHFDRALADLEAVPGKASAKGPPGFA